MSQARVTDFFSTRKRNRFNQDEILLNKQKRTQTLIDSSDFTDSSGGEGNIINETCKLIKQELEMRTRSKTKQLTEINNKNDAENKPAEENKPEEDE